MSSFSAIDSSSLITVHGGQETSVTGRVKTPAVEAEGAFTRRGTPERRSDYNTCMNDRQANCGWFQSPQSCTQMARDACAGMIGSPTNPQRTQTPQSGS